MAALLSVQKYSVAILLKADKPNKNGTCPVVIRVTIDRATSYCFTTYRVHPDDWDSDKRQVKGNVSNSQLINASIKKLSSEAEEQCLLARINKQYIKPQQVVESLGNDGSREDLLAYWKKMLSDLEGVQHPNTIHQFKSDLTKLTNFRSSIRFGQVTPTFLREFDQYMAVTLKNSINTRWKTFKNLKKIFNLANKDKVTTIYPFDGYDCPKYVQTLRTHLTMMEIDRIERLITNGMLSRPLWIAANYFLLSCYSGLRYQDLRAFDPQKHLDADRLVLATKKTGEVVSIQRHKRLNIVIDRLQSRPDLISNQKVNEHLKIIAGMAQIDKDLSCHVGRHTFAVNGAKLGIPSDVMMRLLGHTSLKTTNIYYKISNVEVDSEMVKWDSI